MANPEHVEVVKEGAGAIAAWRAQYPFVVMDLDAADLRGRDLRGANLSAANLDCTHLNRANLSRAKLFASSLFQTRLDGADLTGASIAATVFANVDLSEVRGLDTVRHIGASTIGIDTLFKSKGKIPPRFLRGCGVPDALIEHLPSLIGAMEPIQFYSCFISHSSKDKEFCRRLYSRMRGEKLRVWYAPEALRGGEKLFAQIEEAIRRCEKLLLVLSEHSIHSDWVETEIRQALKQHKARKRRVLFPIRLMGFETLKQWQCFDGDTGRDLAVEVRQYFIPDFSDWEDHDQFEAAFARLMSDLRSEAESGEDASGE